MAQYTTTLRNWCEVIANKYDSEYSIDEVIREAIPKIFNFYFPFYDETKRVDWEVRFVKHFYMREISAETTGLFKLWLEDTLNQIMPKYNKMYEALEKEFAVFQTQNVDEGFTRQTEGNSEGSSEGESVGTHSTTPQGSIDNFLDDKYLDEASKSNSNASSKSSAKNKEDVTFNRKGYENITPASLLKEYSKLFGSVDSLIYKDCESLFFGLWQ